MSERETLDKEKLESEVALLKLRADAETVNIELNKLRKHALALDIAAKERDAEPDEDSRKLIQLDIKAKKRAGNLDYARTYLGMIIPLAAVAITVYVSSTQFFDQREIEQTYRTEQRLINLTNELNDETASNSARRSAASQLGTLGDEAIAVLLNNLANEQPEAITDSVIRAINVAISDSKHRKDTLRELTKAARQEFAEQIRRASLNEWTGTAFVRAIGTVATGLPDSDPDRRAAEGYLDTVLSQTSEHLIGSAGAVESAVKNQLNLLKAGTAESE